MRCREYLIVRGSSSYRISLYCKDSKLINWRKIFTIFCLCFFYDFFLKKNSNFFGKLLKIIIIYTVFLHNIKNSAGKLTPSSFIFRIAHVNRSKIE